MLCRIAGIVESSGKRLLSVILFGSYVYSPSKARDVDVIVVVDDLRDINDKFAMEASISRELGRLFKKSVDVQVYDLSSFKENLTVGTVLTGFALGYKIVYDVAKVKSEIQEFLRRVSEEDEYILVKKRRWNLVALAKARARIDEATEK